MKLKILNQKQGISLTILVITVVVMTILAGATTFTTSTLITNARKTAFSQDLKEIEDAVKSYYVSNNSLPIVTGSVFTKGELLVIAGIHSNVLEEEIILNAEGEDVVYYEIDMEKTGVEASSRGTKLNGNEKDIYVINNKGNVVYYPLGQKIGGEIYFSLTSRLVNMNRIYEENVIGDNTSVSISSRAAINAIKNTEVYTNNLKINVNTIVEDGETLVYTIGSLAEEFEIMELPYTIEISANNLTESQKSNLLELTGQRTITLKRTGDGYFDTEKVFIDNLDFQPPTVSETAIYTSYETFNTITLSELEDVGGRNKRGKI